MRARQDSLRAVRGKGLGYRKIESDGGREIEKSKGKGRVETKREQGGKGKNG